MNNPELRAVLTEAQQAVIRERVSMALHAAESNCLEQGQVPGYSVMAEAAVTATCEALASLPGVAVIQLPEPDESRSMSGTPEWYEDSWYVRSDNQGIRMVTCRDHLKASSAQRLAAALLAAATAVGEEGGK